MKKKHIGKHKDGKQLIIVFRHIIGENDTVIDDNHALVVYKNSIREYSKEIDDIVFSYEAQDVVDLYKVAHRKSLPDGSYLLEYFATRKLLRKVMTCDVIVEYSPTDSIQLDELNKMLLQLESGVTEQDIDATETKSAQIDAVEKSEAKPVDDNVIKAINKSADDEDYESLSSRLDSVVKEVIELNKAVKKRMKESKKPSVKKKSPVKKSAPKKNIDVKVEAEGDATVIGVEKYEE